MGTFDFMNLLIDMWTWHLRTYRHVYMVSWNFIYQYVYTESQDFVY